LYTGFHKFGLEWSPDYLKFYYDGALKRTISNTTIVSDAVEYIILSGGILGWDEGDIRNATLPINEKIAYVRVWTQ
jgi:beta-glucanase (GH16 family)